MILVCRRHFPLFLYNNVALFLFEAGTFIWCSPCSIVDSSDCEGLCSLERKAWGFCIGMMPFNARLGCVLVLKGSREKHRVSWRASPLGI